MSGNELFFQKFKSALDKFIDLPEEDLSLFFQKMKIKHLKKGDYFIRSGETSDSVGFLTEGICRVYYQTDQKEITSYFNYEHRNSFVSSFVSFITGRPSDESIHALKDTTLLVISREQLFELYEQHFSIQKLGRIMAEYNYVLAMDRIYSLQHHSASQRYESLLKTYPMLMNEVPHHYVASYLGITPESLSRLRKEVK